MAARTGPGPGEDTSDPTKVTIEVSLGEKDAQNVGRRQDWKAAFAIEGANLTCSATPGTPIRMPAVLQVSDKTFHKPTAVDLVHVAVPDADYEPMLCKWSTHAGEPG